MGNLGFPELIVICVVALLVFGPKKLPEAGKALGQAIRGFRASLDAKDDAQPLGAITPSPPTCPGCSKTVQADAAFCAHCGRGLKPSL